LTLHADEASARVVPTTSPSTITITVLFASAVPEIAGVAVVTTAAGAVSTGDSGATVSTEKPRVAEGTLVLPAASVAVALAVCAPCASGAATVKLQVPEGLAVTVPAFAPSSFTLTVLLASAVPEMTGVGVLTKAAGPMSTGAAGATVSTVKPRAEEGALVLPAASVAVAVTVCAPCVSGEAVARLQSPEASAVTVLALPPSSRTATVLPASAVPEMIGVAVLMNAAGAVIFAGPTLRPFLCADLTLQEEIEQAKAPLAEVPLADGNMLLDHLPGDRQVITEVAPHPRLVEEPEERLLVLRTEGAKQDAGGRTECRTWRCDARPV
jgi:hypothetical protein